MKKKQIDRKSKHSFGSRFVKGLASCVLAAGCIFSSAGCNVYIVPDPPVDQTQSNNDLNDGNNQNQQDNNQTNNPTPADPEKPVEPDYSQYSQLLQDVLTSDYYNDLIAKDKAAHLGFTGIAEGGANIIENIPFNFLENQGEDIAGIKNNDYFVYCDNYVNNENKNEIFTNISIRFGNYDEDKKTQYYKFYLIKHEITDKELEDYTMLTQGKYYQANFFMQELDNQREAELVNEFSINANAYDIFKAELNNNNEILGLLDNKQVANYVITSFEKGKYNQYVNVEMISDTKSSSAVTGRVALTARFKLNNAWGFNKTNGIFKASKIFFEEQEVSSPTPITYFKNYFAEIKNFIK